MRSNFYDDYLEYQYIFTPGVESTFSFCMIVSVYHIDVYTLLLKAYQWSPSSLSTMMSREGIAAANEVILKELNATEKHDQNRKYTPAQCSAIGKYSSLHGVAAAAKQFSKL